MTLLRSDVPCVAFQLSGSPDERASRRRLHWGLVSVLALAAFVADLRLQPGGEHVTRAVDDLAQLTAGAALGASALWRARRTAGRLRLSWVLIGVGAAGWAGGQAIWSYYELVLAVESPFPSAADAGYLMLPVLAFAGLLVRPSQAFTGRGRVRVGLDVLLVLVSLFTVSWATAFGEVYHDGGDSLFARLVSLAYPAGDVALLTVVVIVVAYAHAGSRTGLLCLGGGLAAFAVADSGFAYLTAKGTYSTGSFVDVFWVTGFVVMAWAAALDRSRSRQGGARSSYVTVVLPFLPTLVGLAFVATRLGPTDTDKLLLSAGIVMVVVLLVRQVVVVSDNYRLVEQMRYQAFHDPLTGLSNRALFNDRLAHALELHRRDHRGVAVILIDLDNFKLVNDSLGHTLGDQLLVEVAHRMRRAARSGDTVARLGGDEFAILLENSVQAEEIAARVLTALAEPLPLGDRQLATGASIGIRVLDPFDDATTASEMMQHADIAMYSAKRAGKGLARSYSSDMALAASGELDLQAALLADLSAGRIDVAYQPVFTAARKLVGFEALARWKFRDAPVSPELFLGVARELGCINVLDEVVLRRAVATAAPLGDLKVSVNVDRMTLAQPSFPARVSDVLAAAGLRPDRLIVEVLEFDRVEREPSALASLTALRNAGVLVSVDDFGAGYATLQRLRLLQPDVIKIDRSLVEGCEDPAAAALLGTAAELGRHIGAAVVAEGVETLAQLDAAVAAGCDGLQGYYLSRPVDADALRRLVASRPAVLAATGIDALS